MMLHPVAMLPRGFVYFFCNLHPRVDIVSALLRGLCKLRSLDTCNAVLSKCDKLRGIHCVTVVCVGRKNAASA
jgi:hypothetical protein